MDLRTRILQHASELFMKVGVRSVTLDEIARGLGISKKTIYQYFTNKAEIVYATMESHLHVEKQDILEIEQQSTNALDEIVQIMHWLVKATNGVNPTLIYEIQKYYPEAWDLMETHKCKFVLESLRSNLQRGIEEGFYRADIDVEVLCRLRIAQIDLLFDEKHFPREQFNFMQVHLEAFKLFMFGLVTEKGHQHLDKQLQTYPDSFLKKETRIIT
ncbi:MAG: TetR/AcrR family transcriptional regulator [Bacteroidota bacterium]